MAVEVSWKALQLTGLPPSPRDAHVMLALDARRILLLGGGSISPVFGPQQFNDMYVLDLKEAQWSQIPSKGEQPSPRTGLSAIVLGDDRVLIFGGSSMTEGYSNDVYILDTKEWVWSRHPVKGEQPSPRDKHTACLLGSKMYVFGGFGPSLVPGNGGVIEANDESDDHDEGTHTDGDAMSENDDHDEGTHTDGDAMSEDCANEDESAEEEENDESCMLFTWFNDLYVLDVISMEWLRLEANGSNPSPRAAHAAFIANVTNHKNCERDEMIVFGGRDPAGRQNDLFSLDLQTLEWRKQEVIAPPARSFHTMVPLVESQLAVCYGGVGVNGEMFPGLELLDFGTMEWKSLKSSNGAWPILRGASAMVASHTKDATKLIIFGGSCSLEDRETVYYNDAYAVDVTSLVNTA